MVDRWVARWWATWIISRDGGTAARPVVFRQGVVTFAVACVVLIALRAVTERMLYPPGDPPWDCHWYYTMAKAPLTLQALPFGSRWLTPALVSLLPVDIETGFEIVNVFGYALSAALIHCLLLGEGITGPAAIFALGAYLTSRYTASWAFHLPVMVDALTHALLAAALLCARRGYFKTLILVTCVGALQKPWVMTALPLHLAGVVLGAPAGSRVRRVLSIAPWYVLPASCFLVFNQRVAALGSYGYLGTANEMLAKNLGSPTGVLRTLTAFVQAFGIAFPVLLADGKGWLAFLRRNPEWLVFWFCCLLMFVTGGTNLESFACYQWPLMAILLASTLKERARFWLRPGNLPVLFAMHLVIGGVFRSWGVGQQYLDKFAYFATYESVVSVGDLYGVVAITLFVWRRSTVRTRLEAPQGAPAI